MKGIRYTLVKLIRCPQCSLVNEMIGRRKIILFIAFMLELLIPWLEGHALSVEWRDMPGRERLIITPAPEDGRIDSVERAAAKAVILSFSSGRRNFVMAASGGAELFNGIEQDEKGISIILKTSAFGYIVTRQDKGVLYVDLFTDPLGRRWQPAMVSSPRTSSSAPPNRPSPAPGVQGGADTKQSVAPVRPELPAGRNFPDAPSSVFSRKLAEPEKGNADTTPSRKEAQPPLPPTPGASGRPERPSSTTPPVGQNLSPSPSLLSDPAFRQGTGDAETPLPSWPPLQMPPALPPPPTPPSSGASPEPHAHRTGIQAIPTSISWLGLRLFMTQTAFAASATEGNADGDYHEVEAPFAYRARLNTARDPSWKEQKIPVMLRVPRSVNFQNQDAPVTQPLPAAPTSAGAAGQIQPPPAQSATPPPQPGPPQTAPLHQEQNTADTALPPTPPPSQANPVPARPSLPPDPARERPQSAVPATSETPAKTVMYVDEFGNQVEPPLDPEAATKKVSELMDTKEYAAAADMLNKLLKQHNLSAEQREIALHRLADATFLLHEDNLVAHYQEIQDTTTAAINFNSRSRFNAAAYLRLGFVNLKAENSYEAAAYF
ncbi:MAG: hypothetical protein LBD82_02285, partial [Deltaproteobacteria bacterium]|nr:hypothetical protein [Deltaproteobacteria bacterium]